MPVAIMTPTNNSRQCGTCRSSPPRQEVQGEPAVGVSPHEGNQAEGTPELPWFAARSGKVSHMFLSIRRFYAAFGEA